MLVGETTSAESNGVPVLLAVGCDVRPAGLPGAQGAGGAAPDAGGPVAAEEQRGRLDGSLNEAALSERCQPWLKGSTSNHSLIFQPN